MGPVPLLVGCLVVGILVGRWFDPPWWFTAVPQAAALVAGALLTLGRNRGSWWLLLLASLLLGGFLGRRAGSGEPHGSLPPLPEGTVLVGRALGDEVVRDATGRFLMRVSGARAADHDADGVQAFLDAFASRDPARRVLVLVRGGGGGVREGDRVWVRSVHAISGLGHRNPGVPQRPWRGGTLVVTAPGPGTLLVARPHGVGLCGLRSLLGERQRGMLSPAVAGLAEAVTTGRAQAVHPVVRDAFRRSGTAHLLAVSGLHLAMVSLVVFGFVRRLASRIPRLAQRIPAQHVAAAVTVVAAWSCAAFASGRPPVLRAALMVTVAALARTSGRRPSLEASLSLVGGILLAASPWLVLAPSFVLSFGAVASIFLAGPRIRTLLRASTVERFISERAGGPVRRLLRIVVASVVELASVSCAASLGTLPAVAAFFGKVPVLGPVVNLVAVPLFSLIFLPSVMCHALLCLLAPRAAHVASPLVEASALPLLQVVSLGARVAPLDTCGPLSLVCVVCVSAAFWLLVARRPRAAAAVAAVAVLLAVAPGRIGRAVRDARLDGKLVAVFLDVGQGDAAYVRTPAGGHLLVDAGPAHPGRGGEPPLPSFLEAWSVSRVDRVFLSHPHADHYGGLSDLLEAGVPVTELVLGVPEDDPGADPGFRDLVDGLRRAGTRVRPPPACGPLHVEGLDAVLVHPCGGDVDDARIDVNDRSAVMAFRHGRICILFTGDIGTAVEADVAASVPFDCTVLKVPHHGSRGSSSLPLLSVPGLEWAVVSARRGNWHGLPHREALARIRSAGLGILRVDLDGGWTVVTDGRSLGMLPAGRWKFSSISRI